MLKKSTTKYTIISILLFAGYYYSGFMRLDLDFGWHLRAGQYMLANGIPKTDIFSYTAINFPWVNHSWLSDIIVAMLYRVGGYASVAGFFALIWTSALLIASRKRSYIVMLLAFMATIPFTGIRMVAWSVLFFAILERLLERKRDYYIWIIPVLFLVWANLHGSFTLGLLVLVLYQAFSKIKLPWYILILSFIATFVNPYGYGIYVEIFRTVLDTDLKNRIEEWKALYLPTLVLPYLIGLLSLHFVFNKHPAKNIISIPGLLFAMALSSIRHTPLFVVSSLRYFEDYVLNLVVSMRSINIQSTNRLRKATILFLGFALVGVVCWQLVLGGVIHGSRDARMPVRAVEYLKSQPCKGQIFNDYNFGGYLIWKLPQSKVYIDGRMPSWSTNNKSYFQNYEKVLLDNEFRTEEFEKYSINCVLIRNKPDFTYAGIIKDLQTSGWKTLDFPEDKYSILLIKNQ